MTAYISTTLQTWSGADTFSLWLDVLHWT